MWRRSNNPFPGTAGRSPGPADSPKLAEMVLLDVFDADEVEAARTLAFESSFIP